MPALVAGIPLFWCGLAFQTKTCMAGTTGSPPTKSAGCPDPAMTSEFQIRQNETRNARRAPSPHRRAAAVPAATALAIDFEAGTGDHDGVLELDESTLRMLQRGLHRHHHSSFERALGIVGVVGHGTCCGQARRLVTHQSHAVGEEMHVVVVLG